VSPAPAENLTTGEGAAVGPRELESPVQEREDGVPADEGEFAVWELAAEELVDCALLLGGDRIVAGTFARVVAGPTPPGAPGSGLAEWEAPARRRRYTVVGGVSRASAMCARDSPAS
jgi:hypothetical protein